MLVLKGGAESFSWARHTGVECVRHLHPHLEIIIVTEGVLHMRVRGCDYVINSGHGIFVFAFEPHEFHSPKHNKCTVLMFSRELAMNFYELLRSKTVASHIFAVSDQSQALLKRILPKDGYEVGYFEAQALLAPICLDILQGCEFTDGNCAPEGYAERAFEYINAHYADNISLESVAHAIGVHPVTLSKIFAKNMGVGFNSCVQNLRCINASTMIKSQSATLTEIAMACGFGSVRSFNRSFKSFFGITPSEYRES